MSDSRLPLRMPRLIVLSILLLISLLAVIRAPQYHLWLLAIVVTELPWIWVLVTSAGLLAGFKTNRFVLAGTIVGIIALALFISPIARILPVAGKLNNGLNAAFGGSDKGDVPFRIGRMFSAFSVSKDVPLVRTYFDDLSLDFYPAHTQGARPCVIVVHGGSWAGGDSRQLDDLNTVMARGGYHVLSINYRLAPQYKSPEQVNDLAAAIAYVKQHATDLHIDTSHIVILGRSAGAQIALAGAYTLHDSCIKGVISFYGPADMVWGYSLPANPLVFDSRKVMTDYLGGTYEEVPQQYFNSSPIEFVTPQSPPTLLIHGPLDPLVAYEHSVRLSAKLQQMHVPYYFLDLPCGTHGCDATLSGPSGQVTTYAVLRFLDNVCR